MAKGTIEQQIAAARYTVDQEIDNFLAYESDKKLKQSKILEDRKASETSAIDVLITQLKRELNDALGDNLFNALNMQYTRPQTVCFLAVVASFEYRQRNIILSIKDDFSWVISGFGEDVVCVYEHLKDNLIKFLAVIKSSPNIPESTLTIEAVTKVETPKPDSSLTNVATPEASPIEVVAEVENPTPDSNLTSVAA